MPFVTSSLCDALEGALVRGVTSEEALWESKERVSLELQHKTRSIHLMEALNPMSLSMRSFGEAVCVLLSELPTEWSPRATATQHHTWDDCSGRDTRACNILLRLRSCGDWQLLPVTFGRRASFLGGLRCPHVDIIALPGQTKTDAGAPVLRNLARVIIEAEV